MRYQTLVIELRLQIVFTPLPLVPSSARVDFTRLYILSQRRLFFKERDWNCNGHGIYSTQAIAAFHKLHKKNAWRTEARILPSVSTLPKKINHNELPACEENKEVCCSHNSFTSRLYLLLFLRTCLSCCVCVCVFLLCIIPGPANILCLTVARGWNNEWCIPKT